MRIAFITEYRGMGGGETNLLRICSALSDKYEIGLFCASGELLESALEIKKTTFKVTEISPVRNLWRKDFPVPFAPFSLISALNKYDIIHSYSPNPLPMLIWLKKPIAWTVHGYWERPFGIRAWFINMFVNKILPVSSDVNSIVDFPDRKTELIHLGAVSESDIKSYYVPFDGVNLTIACIGSFQVIKGQDVLLDAIETLSKKMPHLSITLNLLGDINGSNESFVAYREKIIRKIDSIRSTRLNIVHHGFQKNVESHIKLSHFIVVPSRYESFSMVTVEALSKGKQVIGPDIGGPKEILSYPKTGRLFIPGDPISLSENLSKAINEYAEYNMQETLQRAVCFTVEKQLAKLELAYKHMIKSYYE